MPLCDSPKCPARGKRKYPPGAHGPKRGYPRSQSVYGKQLRAKQKAKRTYGMMERQFRRFFEEASRIKGNTAEHLVHLLESRLDNVVYRLGLADTRPQARQFVAHRHILVNGKKINIPSYIVKKEDIIAFSKEDLKKEAFQQKMGAVAKKTRPGWLTWDVLQEAGKVVDAPIVEDVVKALEPHVIVELYSK